MRAYDVDLYLNGIRMAGKRRPPQVDTDKFIKAMVSDLLLPTSRKHQCSQECEGIWTIAIGPEYTEKNTFMECIPW